MVSFAAVKNWNILYKAREGEVMEPCDPISQQLIERGRKPASLRFGEYEDANAPHVTP